MIDQLKEKLFTYGVLIFIPIILVLCIWSISGYMSIKNENDTLRAELEIMEKNTAIMNANKDLIQDNIDDYNQVLSTIIPEQEDYFSIIFALEKLSEQTGFIVTRYSVGLKESTGEKLALNIEGTGDATAFLNFLKQYQYSGGRLITNEKIEFTPGSSGNIKLTLNFYHKNLLSLKEQLSLITPQDVNITSEIREKVAFAIKEESTNEESTSYETKSNPF